jgi:hypothetical protein
MNNPARAEAETFKLFVIDAGTTSAVDSGDVFTYR